MFEKIIKMFLCKLFPFRILIIYLTFSYSNIIMKIQQQPQLREKIIYHKNYSN